MALARRVGACVYGRVALEKPRQTIRAWKGRKPRDALESNSARDTLAPLANPMSSEASYEIYQNLPETIQQNNDNHTLIISEIKLTTKCKHQGNTGDTAQN